MADTLDVLKAAKDRLGRGEDIQGIAADIQGVAANGSEKLRDVVNTILANANRMDYNPSGDKANLSSELDDVIEKMQGGRRRRRGKKTRKGRRMSRRWRGGLDTPMSFPKPLPKDPLDAAIALAKKFRDAVMPSRFSGTPVELKIVGTQGEKDAIDRLIEVLRKEKESQQSTVTGRAASAFKGLFGPKKGGAVTEMLMEKLAELKTTKKVTIDTDLQSVFEKLNNAVSILEQQKEDESGASVDVGKPGLGSLGITAASSFGGKPRKSRRYTRRR